MTGLRQFALPIAAGAGLFLAAAPAFSQEQQIIVTGKIPQGYEAVRKIVRIADLNLATDAGKVEMEKRVGRAVQDICATPSPMGQSEKRLSKQCSDMAWASARPQMDEAVRRTGP